MGFIYKITNKTNGDFYIGQTRKSIKKRFNSHISNAYNRNISNNYFYNSIIKYGKENFFVELIEEIDNDFLDEREIFFINQLQPAYNTSLGGKSTKGFTGKKLSKIHKEKLINSNIKKIYQYDLEGNFIREWESTKAVERDKTLNCNKTISHCLNKKQKTSCGYFWSNIFLGNKIPPIIKKIPRIKSIIQMDLQENIIKIWDSMSDIERNLGITTSKICLCCKGIRKQTKGFKFKYFIDE